MNYDEMEAGREMDALVAEKVMGRGTVRKNYLGNIEYYAVLSKYCESYFSVPYYSISISDAWEVVEKMVSENVVVSVQYDDAYKRWKMVMRQYEEILNYDFWPWADTAPLAICRAALKAVSK